PGELRPLPGPGRGIGSEADPGPCPVPGASEDKSRLVDIDDVGAIAAFLVSDLADAITGNTTFIDAGYHIMG
ncbi:MAG: enoyl-[acyl-carrier protein] reductase, partial [Thermodesulfobacteriota bacterium]|nr:enoyl-[acyl-carrier protein] reductase [Thermodesulfobacteriota bacterium]